MLNVSLPFPPTSEAVLGHLNRSFVILVDVDALVDRGGAMNLFTCRKNEVRLPFWTIPCILTPTMLLLLPSAHGETS